MYKFEELFKNNLSGKKNIYITYNKPFMNY